MINRYHKLRSKKIIGIIHRKCGYSFFINNKIFDRVDIKVSVKDLITKYNDWFKFTIVRNPYDRILSIYNDKVIENPVEKINNNNNILQECQKKIAKANNILPDLNNFKNITFDIFINNLHKLYLSDSQFTPFYLLTCYNNSIICDYVGKFETFEKSLNYLHKKNLMTLPSISKNINININIFKKYNINTFIKVSMLYETDLKIFYPKLYEQLTNYIIVYENGLNQIIEDKLIELHLFNMKISKIKNSFLDLFFNYDDVNYNKYLDLLK